MGINGGVPLVPLQSPSFIAPIKDGQVPVQEALPEPKRANKSSQR